METRNIFILPETGYVRLSQFIPSIIPISKSTWWAGVSSGRYPKPVKLSERCTAWRVEDIRSLIDCLSKQALARIERATERGEPLVMQDNHPGSRHPDCTFKRESFRKGSAGRENHRGDDYDT